MKTVSQVPKPKRGTWVKTGATFSCGLRDLRAKYGIGLREVAKHSGVSVATIARIEWGSECQLSAALKLARFYETTVEAIWKLQKGAPGEGL